MLGQRELDINDGEVVHGLSLELFSRPWAGERRAVQTFCYYSSGSLSLYARRVRVEEDEGLPLRGKTNCTQFRLRFHSSHIQLPGTLLLKPNALPILEQRQPVAHVDLHCFVLRVPKKSHLRYIALSSQMGAFCARCL